MNERENAASKERPASPERPNERQVSLEQPRAERRQEIETEADRIAPDAVAPERLAAFQKEKEAKFAAYASAIESALATEISPESKSLIHGNVVESPIAFAARQAERLQELQREKGVLDAENAIKLLVGYDDAAMREKIETMGGKNLTYGSAEDGYEVIGTAHTNNPESETVKALAKQRDAFLAGTSKKDAVFMVEGIYNPEDLAQDGLTKLLHGLDNEAEAVKKFGEKGALLWTAKNEGVEVTSPEKPQDQIVAELGAQGFSKDEIGLYLTMRQFTSEIGQPHPDATPESSKLEFARMFYDFDRLAGTKWINEETRTAVDAAVAKRDVPTLEALTTKVVAEYVAGANRAFAETGKADAKTLVPSLEGLLRRNEGVPDDQKVAMDAVNAQHDPRGNVSTINKVSAAWNSERDKHLVRQIAAAKAKGKKPFVVYGASHAIAIEPALKNIARKE